MAHFDCSSGTSDIGLSISNDETEPSSPSRRYSSSTAEEANALKKVVLVTGGAGFIGSHVSDFLLERGDKVVVVDEMNDYYEVRLKHANLEYLVERHGSKVVIYRGDICDLDFISKVFEKERPTHVCHLAGVRASIIDPYIYVHSNIEGTTRLLDMARQYSVQNFVYASSSSVYGCSDRQVLQEADAVEKPVSPYAATKKACELLAYTFHHLYGLNCTGLRFFTVYGPRGRPDMAPFKFIDRVFQGLPIQQYGDGSTSRDYTYIDDIVSGVVGAVDTPLGYEVINLGNGRPYQLKAFIQLVEASVGRQAVIEVVPEQPGDVDRTCADITKAKTLLGYNPKVPFEEGIALTAQWYLRAQAAGLFDDGGSSRSHLGPGTGAALDRSTSDLELSSFVEKAPNQLRQRRERVFKATKNAGFSSPQHRAGLQRTRSSGRLSAAAATASAQATAAGSN